jgi:16S rRNA (uracil1498-N3)-methyltransferase
MESFYVPPERIADGSLTIDGGEFHHLAHVLRKKEGDTVTVVDGQGTAMECVIETIGRDAARCGIRAVRERYNEPAVDATVMLPILKNHSRIEWLVEKGTELGVRRFIPVQTVRTIPRSVRCDRLRKLALSAMKQCLRSFLPLVLEPASLEDVVRDAEGRYERIYVGHEAATGAGLRNGEAAGGRVLILAGPEGGFTGEEIELCRAGGGAVVSLGPRRYRAETAALLMAALIIHD